jgi:NCAIR mutase (PurE)-related protein
MTEGDFIFDYGRRERMGLDESVFCEGKSVEQIAAILTDAETADPGLLLTRLAPSMFAYLPENLRERMDYHAQSRTAFYGPVRMVADTGKVAIVAAGTSDMPVACEAARTLRHAGVGSALIADVGVAGLWRLTNRIEDIRRYPIVIAVAGMDAALASVLGGLVSSAIICVPTSIGYGAADHGRTALGAMLSSCASGLTVCNIDNGYGAACAALRILNTITTIR